MTVFYGLSVGLWRGHDVTGASLADDAGRLRYRTDESTVTMTAGDSFVVAAYGPESSSNIPAPDDDVVISWVLEVDSPSAGSVRLSTGTTTGVSVDEAACGEALGVYDATGAVTIAAKQSSYTVTGYLNTDVNSNLFVECLSGVVVLRQVKVRVWPAAGPVGAWAPAPAYAAPAPYRQHSFTALVNNEGPQFGDPLTAHTDGRNRLYAQLGEMIEATAPDPTSSTRDALQVAEANWSLNRAPSTAYWWVTGGVSASYLVFANPGPQMVPGPGVDGWIEPNEVAPEGQVRGPGGAPLGEPSFLHWTGALVSYEPGNASDLLGAVGVAPPLTVPSGSLVLVPFALPSSLAAAPVDVSGITTEALLLASLPQEMFDTPNGGYLANSGANLNGAGAVMLVPAYEVWNPSAEPPKPDREPRFFVVYEGDDRPVGFGKPEDERHLFGVQTALGNYRDLTFAEYETAGDPLSDFTP